MIVYVKNLNILFVPENGESTHTVKDPEQIYQEAFDKGYQDGYDDALEECQNNG